MTGHSAVAALEWSHPGDETHTEDMDMGRVSFLVFQYLGGGYVPYPTEGHQNCARHPTARQCNNTASARALGLETGDRDWDLGGGGQASWECGKNVQGRAGTTGWSTYLGSPQGGRGGRPKEREAGGGHGAFQLGKLSELFWFLRLRALTLEERGPRWTV